MATLDNAGGQMSQTLNLCLSSQICHAVQQFALWQMADECSLRRHGLQD